MEDAAVGTRGPRRRGVFLHRHGGATSVARARLLAGPYRAQHHAGDADRHGEPDGPNTQPGFLSSWVGSFAAFDSAHGWAVNLFLVVSLGAIGLLFMSGRARFALVGVVAGIVLCLADWVLIEDLGFLGGVGTDPNSMIPMALIFVGGYLAMTRVPHADDSICADEAAASRPSWAERVMTSPGYSFRALAAVGAIAIVLVGAVPMAEASTNPNADPIVAQAVDGSPNITDRPTPSFHLVDQRRRVVSLRDLHGKTIVLAFLDPVCVSDCPIIAQELPRAETASSEGQRATSSSSR